MPVFEMLKVKFFLNTNDFQRRPGSFYAAFCFLLRHYNGSNYLIMKTLVSVLLLSVFVVSSCHKDCKSMIVVRDCTGTYLQDDGKDYQVCNKEKLAGYTNGETVNARYHKISDCTGDEVICMMVHVSEGWIEVDEVK